jgi:hypothetical protein
MRVPDSILDRYGQPENVSGKWANFYHRCAEERGVGGGKLYPMLLYNLESGWVVCKACGHKARGDASDDADGMQSQAPYLGEVSEAAAQSLRGARALTQSEEVSRCLIKDRGFTWEELQQYGVMTGDDNDPGSRFYRYAIFPLYHEGELVSWHARDCLLRTRQLGDNHPHRRLLVDRGHGSYHYDRKRWLSPAGRERLWSRRQCWWGLDRVERGDVVFICEGIMDAAYFSTGCAYMGPVPTEVQVAQLLDRGPASIFVCADRDMDRDLIVKAIRAKDKYITVIASGSPIPKLSVEYPDYGAMLAKGLRYSPEEGETSTSLRSEMWWLDMED